MIEGQIAPAVPKQTTLQNKTNMNDSRTLGHGDAVAEHGQKHRRAPKWAALVDDVMIPSPQREVRASVLLAQAGAKPEFVLVCDHGDEQDVAFARDEVVDLAAGNIFYLVPSCDAPQKGQCIKPAKLAFFVDDRAEITINPQQTGKTLRELFGLTDEVNLVRDYESAHDEPVSLIDAASFERGPVFITRRQSAQLKIIVNSKPFDETDGVKKVMTGRQIAALVSDNPDCTEVFLLEKGKPKPVPLDQQIQVKNCDEFRVIRNNVCGGFEPSRVQRELQRLSQGGCSADFFSQPFPAVVYRNVPTRPGYSHLQMTDVLVAVPNGYPGQPLDGAYLPEGSPLLGRVAGSPQGVVIAGDGRRWQLVSYHPHNGGGAPPWNKDKHGFHTYIDEILCWIHRANN